MQKINITISSEYWDKSDIIEISNVFSQSVEQRKIERWATESLDPALLITFVWIGKEIATGFLNSIGQSIWEQLKIKISKKVEEKEYPGLTMSFKSGDSEVDFELKTKDPEIIKKGFDTIDSALKTIQNSNEKIIFNFNEAEEKWEKNEDREFVKTITGVCVASGVPIVKDGKTFVLKDEDLPHIAKMNLGIPFTLGHDGKVDGKITKTWIDGTLVKFEAGIYAGLSDEEMKQLDGVKGISMGFTRPED